MLPYVPEKTKRILSKYSTLLRICIIAHIFFINLCIKYSDCSIPGQEKIETLINILFCMTFLHNLQVPLQRRKSCSIFNIHFQSITSC